MGVSSTPYRPLGDVIRPRVWRCRRGFLTRAGRTEAAQMQQWGNSSDIRTTLGTFSPWVLMTDGSRGPVNVYGLVPPFDEGGQGFLHIQGKQMLFHKRTSKRRRAMVVLGPGFTLVCGNLPSLKVSTATLN